MYNNVIYVIDFIKKQKSIKCDREIKNTEKGKRKKKNKEEKKKKSSIQIQIYPSIPHLAFSYQFSFIP